MTATPPWAAAALSAASRVSRPARSCFRAAALLRNVPGRGRLQGAQLLRQRVGQPAHRGRAVPDVFVESAGGVAVAVGVAADAEPAALRVQARDVHGVEQVVPVQPGVLGQFVQEVVVAAAVLHHELGLGDGELVLRGGLVGVRVLAGPVDDRGDPDLAAADAADDVAVHAGGSDDLHHPVAGAGPVAAGRRTAGRQQEAAEAGKDNCGGGTAHGETSDLLLRSISNTTSVALNGNHSYLGPGPWRLLR